MEKTSLQDFRVMDFPARAEQGFVYVLCWVDGTEEGPFYVGETQSIWGRLNDYYWADFQASTDFRVGQAVRYLRDLGLRVVARYRPSQDRKGEERMLIAALRGEGPLLNDLRSYDYLKANVDDERQRVHADIDRIVASHRNRSDTTAIGAESGAS